MASQLHFPNITAYMYNRQQTCSVTFNNNKNSCFYKASKLSIDQYIVVCACVHSVSTAVAINIIIVTEKTKAE